MKTYEFQRLARILSGQVSNSLELLAFQFTERNRDFFSLASTPNAEDCSPASHAIDNHKWQRAECEAYKNQLIRMYGFPPEGGEFFILENHHEFGIYYEVGIFYKTEEEQSQSDYESREAWEASDFYQYGPDPSPSLEYAQKCELGPDNWDEEAIAELKKSGHPRFNVQVIPIKRTA